MPAPLKRTRYEGPYECAVCGSTRALEDHHVTPRSRGGTDGATLRVCQNCHRNFTDEAWELDYDPGVSLVVVDRTTGVVVKQQEFSPQFDQGEALSRATVMALNLESLTARLKYMDNAGLDHLHALADEVTRKSWFIKCAIYHEAMRRHPDIGKKKDSLAAVARRFCVSPSTVRKYLVVWEAHLRGDFDLDTFTLDEPYWYVMAYDEGGKDRALELLAFAQEQKDSGMSLSMAQFREHIHGKKEFDSTLERTWYPTIRWTERAWICTSGDVGSPYGILMVDGATPNEAHRNWRQTLEAKLKLEGA